MDKRKLDERICEVAKTILSYCTVRTSNHHDAEDLAQDIILEIYRSAGNLRNEDAFYGFMWSIAGNVYKNWCKKRSKAATELPETLSYEDAIPAIDNCELYLLRRELTLLGSRYRSAVILYYIEGRSCRDIASDLKTSESMVKYLLFKSRQILMEGMNMERNYGTQSYDPKSLTIYFWGSGANRYYDLGKSKISQNILFACYNDRLTAEEISLEIGVALPYMEDRLAELLEYELILKDGNKYYTNIPIFTNEFVCEVTQKTAHLRDRIADIVENAIVTNEKSIRALGFAGCDMKASAFAWQMTCILLYEAILARLAERVKLNLPRDKFGTECRVWAGEDNNSSGSFGFGRSNTDNAAGDRIQFMDFQINGEMVHHYHFGKQTVSNIFLDIAKGNTEHLSENDLAIAADMVKKGYVISDGGRLSVNAPIFTAKQYEKIVEIFAADAEAIATEAEALMDTVSKILKEHMPMHLKKLAYDMAYIRLFDDALSASVATLYERKYLIPYTGDGILPTTYVRLN